MLRFTLEDNIVDVLIKIEPQIERLGKLSAEEAAGYKGLYNGLGCDDIKVRKGIAKSENLIDQMDTTELAANQFRMTQAHDKLARERIEISSRRSEPMSRSVAKSACDSGALAERCLNTSSLLNTSKKLRNA